MLISMQPGATIALVIALGLVPGICLAQQAGLPGGASSLTERHGDWTVACSTAQQDEKLTKVCGLTQQQVNAEGKRVLAIELLPDPSGAVGNLVLLFGLDLATGVQLLVDETELTQPLPYGTCMPVGCLVELRFGPDLVSALRAGGVLTARPAVLGGESADFTISLAGFSAAYDRASELLN